MTICKLQVLSQSLPVSKKALKCLIIKDIQIVGLLKINTKCLLYLWKVHCESIVTMTALNLAMNFFEAKVNRDIRCYVFLIIQRKISSNSLRHKLFLIHFIEVLFTCNKFTYLKCTLANICNRVYNHHHSPWKVPSPQTVSSASFPSIFSPNPQPWKLPCFLSLYFCVSYHFT